MKIANLARLVSAGTLVAVFAATASAQDRPEKKESAAQEKKESASQLKAQAKITEAAARTTALAEVPGGKVKEGELEKEKGKLVYSYDIAVAGKPGIEEVQVDAVTGKIVSHVHETPADEAKEAAKDKAAAAKAHKARKETAKKP